MLITVDNNRIPRVTNRQRYPFIRKADTAMRMPATRKEMPPNLWHFFQVVWFFMFQGVRRPITEL